MKNTRLSVLLTFTMAVSAGSWLNAQEEEPESVDEFSTQSMVIAASDDEGGVGVQVFSTMDGGIMEQPAFIVGEGMMHTPDIFSLANNQGVQKEIELVDDQMQQIRKINKEFSQQISDQVGEMTSGDMNAEKGRRLTEMIKELNEQKKARMEGVLLPHQFDRLRQIALQTQMKNQGDASTLGSEKVAEVLGITDEQKQRIEQRAEELKKEMNDRIAELKAKAREELLDELTREQREKLTEMMGDTFELKTPDFRERIRNMREKREKQSSQSDSRKR